MSDSTTTPNGESSDDQDGEDTYVHRPSGEPPRQAATGEQSFGWRGWLLVAAIVFAFLVAPWALILLTSVQGAVADLGLGYRNTFLVVPLLPAVVLGLLGVWTALRSRQ